MVIHIKHQKNSLLLRKAAAFLKNNTVLAVAVTAAAVTSFIVPPDSAYIEYFDFKTLTCLFCTLAVICALKNINFFTIAAKKIVFLTGLFLLLSLLLSVLC